MAKIRFLFLSVVIFLTSVAFAFSPTDLSEEIAYSLLKHEKHLDDTLIKRSVYQAVPYDLIGSGIAGSPLPLNARGCSEAELDIHLEAPGRNNGIRKSPEYPNFFKAETTEYGQLKSILEKNGGDKVDSLIVVGPMDKSDFKAIWDCAVYGNMQVLNLEGARMKDNEVPDYALYDFIQFQTAFWLRMKRIILPEGIERIGKAAFALMGLQEINIPSTVRDIGSSAFTFDRRLDCELIIPEGVEAIRYQTFNECHGLKTTPKLPSTLRRIESHAFAITTIDSISFPSNLEGIDIGAFQNTNIKSAHLPNSCHLLGTAAFQLCVNLKELTLPETLEAIPESAFSFCYSLEKVNINAQCKTIGSQAFICCINLREVNFNNGLLSIGDCAFHSCEIKEVALPPSIQKLEDYCLEKVLNVSCAATNPPVCEADPKNSEVLPFGRTDDMEGSVLYVPKGTAETYARQWGWNYFTEIIETDDFPWTAVNTIEADKKPSDKDIYDLNGQRVKSPTHGQIYIKDGKKVLL